LDNSLIRLLAVTVEIVPLLADAKHRPKEKAEVDDQAKKKYLVLNPNCFILLQ
jgi:hypothetical protein